jgi:hypothetical protein
MQLLESGISSGDSKPWAHTRLVSDETSRRLVQPKLDSGGLTANDNSTGRNIGPASSEALHLSRFL